MINTDFKLKNFKVMLMANCLKQIFTSELKFLVPKDGVPKARAPDKMVRVLADCMIKNL